MVTVTAATRLFKMSDTSLETIDPGEDVRGRKVLDRAGEEIGKVKDLFVDEAERRVRFLEVRSGGFLGIGAVELLIPVDAVTGVDDEAVHVDQSREKVAGGPRYDPRLHNDLLWADFCHYYGCTPYWEPDYRYPRFPSHPRGAE